MKKMYIQPIVEETELFSASMVMAGSPGTLINNNNNTSGIPNTGDIISQ